MLPTFHPWTRPRSSPAGRTLRRVASRWLLRLRRAAPLVAMTCAGCVVVHPGTAGGVGYEELRRTPGWVLLEDVRFVAQETEEDCGAAALSMVLARWGIDVPPATLQRECAVPGVPGLAAADLRDAARRRGLSAFLFAGNVADLEHELGRGRPVIVGLVQSFATTRVAHFEVVVGLRLAEQVAALDPSRGLVCDTLAAFTAEWAMTQGVTLVVFRPEPVPPTAVADRP